MFGIVRPCSHRLGEGLKTQWMAHLCGLCLALRSDHGQFARVVTNYDGLLVSVLTEGQVERATEWRRTAGPCPLRGMRGASVAQGEGARLAAAVSLVLASAKVRDHVADGDGMLGRKPVALAARRVARSWDRAGARTGADVGFDTSVLVDAVRRQGGIEALAGPGTSLLVVTEPTETATAAAFAHTAHLAGRPGNAAPLAEAGRLFGRLAHLLDAVEDRQEDAVRGAWNPLAVTGTSLTEARRLADDALRGIRLALRDVEFTDAGLAHRLLVHELPRSVDRAFGTTGCSHQQPGSGGSGPVGPYVSYPQPGPGGPGGPAGPYAPQQPGPGGPGGPYGPGPGGPFGPPPGGPGGPRPPRRDRRGLIAGCLVWAGLACTCQLCCGTHEDPWSRERKEGLCNDCCGACDCCSNCSNCCSCCGGDGESGEGDDGGCCDGCDCNCDCGCG
ncbi:DUF5685 family protein [Streptomyces luteolus]|uniref:DUF5685 family protein n=1 Tax=Streptomyces luteolus TaxID=3043615 RepID=A0ABT6STN8_9ACTN|nr:DUF5685 family protein [Streptomyces sp. B-S-A12]MDI3418980.1 DUF5685 family protein [Streptomyces sp. B-S-A12]